MFRDDTVYRDHSLCSSLQLDGSNVGGKALHPSAGVLGISRTTVQSAQVLSPTSSRSFMFSKVELTGILSIPHMFGILTHALTEEDEYLNQGSAHLGEIQIRMYRAQHCGTVPFKAVVAAPGHAKVHERGKKAVTHCVSCVICKCYSTRRV